MTAQEKLEIQFSKGFHITVGLDTDINKIPKHLLNKKNPVLDFNRIIIDSTAEYAAAFKINFAFYEKDGAKGFEDLKETINYIPKEKFIIADAKRGDIGNTSDMYAKSVFEYFAADAITLHPYMGSDSLQSFLDYKDKMSFILALTSNKGAADFEKLKLEDGSFLFQKVIKTVTEWNKNKNCGLVFGATNSQELKDNAGLFGELPVLLPGIGAQGGSLEDVIEIFKLHNNHRFLINVSRSLIYKDSSEKFDIAAKNEIISLNDIINSRW